MHSYSYWTDNGACYYHSTGSQCSNYEEVFVAVKKDADQKGIPYKYVQVSGFLALSVYMVVIIRIQMMTVVFISKIDDWWYYQDAGEHNNS